MHRIGMKAGGRRERRTMVDGERDMHAGMIMKGVGGLGQEGDGC